MRSLRSLKNDKMLLTVLEHMCYSNIVWNWSKLIILSPIYYQSITTTGMKDVSLLSPALIVRFRSVFTNSLEAGSAG